MRKREKLNGKDTMRMIEIKSDIFLKFVVLISLISRNYRDFEIARRRMCRFFYALYETSVTVKERRVKRSSTGHDWIIADSPPLRCSILPSTTAFRDGTCMSIWNDW